MKKLLVARMCCSLFYEGSNDHGHCPMYKQTSKQASLDADGSEINACTSSSKETDLQCQRGRAGLITRSAEPAWPTVDCHVACLSVHFLTPCSAPWKHAA